MRLMILGMNGWLQATTAIEGIRKDLQALKQGKGRNVDLFFEEFDRKQAIDRYSY